MARNNRVRPTVRHPVLRTCKKRIALSATTFTLFKAATKKTTKELAHPNLLRRMKIILFLAVFCFVGSAGTVTESVYYPSASKGGEAPQNLRPAARTLNVGPWSVFC